MSNSNWNTNRLEQIIKSDNKGKLAEAIVEDIFFNKNYEVFETNDNHSHLCDFYVVNKNNLNQEIFIDSKSKQARNYYKDTGVDVRAYDKYIKFITEKQSNFLLFFVDQKLGFVYYFNLKNTIPEFGDDKYKFYLDVDEIQYPKPETNKNNDEKYIYFSLEQMTPVRKLTDLEIKMLDDYSDEIGTNRDFKPTWDYKTLLIKWEKELKNNNKKC